MLVLVHRPAAVPLFEARAQRCANVGIGATVQQQTREVRLVGLTLAVVDPEAPLTDD